MIFASPVAVTAERTFTPSLIDPQINVILWKRICCLPSQALIALLASLSVPIVPENVCQALSGAEEVGDIGARARSFVLDLPPLHRDVFVYLVRYALTNTNPPELIRPFCDVDGAMICLKAKIQPLACCLGMKRRFSLCPAPTHCPSFDPPNNYGRATSCGDP